MRRSPRLALALILAAGPLSAQEKNKELGAADTRPMPQVLRLDPVPPVSTVPASQLVPHPAPLPPVANWVSPAPKPLPSAPLSRQLAIMSGFDMKQTEKQIACEVLIVRLSDEAMKQMRFPDANAPEKAEMIRGVSSTGIQQVGFQSETKPNGVDAKRRVQFVNARTKQKMLEAFQQDMKTSVMQAPKVTMFPSEPAVVEITDSRHFLTDVKVRAVNGSLIFTPNNEVVNLGTKLGLSAVPSADGKFVRLKANLSVTELSSEQVPLLPLTTKITPKFENGAVGEPTDFTQFLQSPNIITRTLDESFVIPTDHSVVAYVGSASREVEKMDFGPPVLSKVPYLNRLFKNAARGTETDHLIVIMTPQVIKPEAICPIGCATTEAPAKRTGNEQLQLLLKAYHSACVEGLMDDARRLAIECLVIDPTCFGKK